MRRNNIHSTAAKQFDQIEHYFHDKLYLSVDSSGEESSYLVDRNTHQALKCLVT